jgi:hypothetical protein
MHAHPATDPALNVRKQGEVTGPLARVSGDVNGRRQCTATGKWSGERCKKSPIPGGNVCILHGGGSPLAVRAAQRTLAVLAEAAFETMADCMGACDPDGEPLWPVRLAAAKTLASRAGYGEQSKLLIQSDDSVDSLEDPQIAADLETIAQEIRRRAAQRTNVALPSSSNVVEMTPQDNGSWQPQV